VQFRDTAGDQIAHFFRVIPLAFINRNKPFGAR
jgi:hypothetical protein